MHKNVRALLILTLIISSSPLFAGTPPEAAIPVRYPCGLLHGFLLMRDSDGTVIADGELTQVVQGDRVTSHVIFHFKDGSLQEETTVFSQRHRFRLINDHLVQKGPAFKTPLDLSINGLTGAVTVHSTDSDGKSKDSSDTLTVPPNLANGLIPTLLANFPSGAGQMSLSLIVATPKPRLVELAFSAVGEDKFSVGSTTYKATNYVMKIHLGGVTGVVAPIVGKQPADSHFWISTGPAPFLAKSEGPQFEDGPVWHVELASPSWPR